MKLSDINRQKNNKKNPAERMHWYEAEVTCKMGITGFNEEDAKEAMNDHLKLYTRDAKIHKFYLKADDAWAPDGDFI